MDPRTNLAGEKHSPASCVRLLLLAGTTGGDHAASLELFTSFQAVYYNQLALVLLQRGSPAGQA